MAEVFGRKTQAVATLLLAMIIFFKGYFIIIKAIEVPDLL